MLKILIITSFLTMSQMAYAQSVVIHTNDIDNFWNAYDSVKIEKDPSKQITIIQKLYLDRASSGLKAMIGLRNWTSAKFQEHITQNENFWATIRPKTLSIKAQIPDIEKLYSAYKRLYKNFVAPEIYFVIGYIQTGGTTTQNQILIGAEISAGDRTVNTAGLHPFIQNFMRTNNGILPLIAHEITHTQQKGGDMETRRNSNLLGFCLAEGSCDFIAELLTGTKVDRSYMSYGKAHERELWHKFKLEMYGREASDWLYNGFSKKNGDADLGYYMGYAICKSYYENAVNKEKAIAEIVSLDLDNVESVGLFLANSGYNP